MICIPIKQKRADLVFKKFGEAQNKAELTEIWFDEIEDLSDKSIEKIFKTKKKPLIYKTTTLRNLKSLKNKKIEMIDLDISTKNEMIRKIKTFFPNIKIILSYHNFRKTPTNNTLKNKIKEMLSKKADILKIATFANEFSDSLRILELLNQFHYSYPHKKGIFLCMGGKGKITREVGHLLGNYIMFAPATNKEKTAQGQIDIEKLRKIQNLYK